jgi:hypothetical protein
MYTAMCALALYNMYDGVDSIANRRATLGYVGLKDLNPVFATIFGLVERSIRIFDQLVSIDVGTERCGANTDAGREGETCIVRGKDQ